MVVVLDQSNAFHASRAEAKRADWAREWDGNEVSVLTNEGANPDLLSNCSKLHPLVQMPTVLLSHDLDVPGAWTIVPLFPLYASHTEPRLHPPN